LIKHSIPLIKSDRTLLWFPSVLSDRSINNLVFGSNHVTFPGHCPIRAPFLILCYLSHKLQTSGILLNCLGFRLTITPTNLGTFTISIIVCYYHFGPCHDPHLGGLNNVYISLSPSNTLSFNLFSILLPFSLAIFQNLIIF